MQSLPSTAWGGVKLHSCVYCDKYIRIDPQRSWEDGGMNGFHYPLRFIFTAARVCPFFRHQWAVYVDARPRFIRNRHNLTLDMAWALRDGEDMLISEWSGEFGTSDMNTHFYLFADEGMMKPPLDIYSPIDPRFPLSFLFSFWSKLVHVNTKRYPANKACEESSVAAEAQSSKGSFLVNRLRDTP